MYVSVPVLGIVFYRTIHPGMTLKVRAIKLPSPYWGLFFYQARLKNAALDI